MSLLWYNSKNADQNGASSDEDSAEYHPWREDISEQKAGKEGVPKQRDGA